MIPFSLPDVNERLSAILLSAKSVPENEAGTVVGKVIVQDPDVGQRHRCTVHDQVVDPASRKERLVPSHFFTVDSSLNLKTLNALNFEAEHSLDIVINCSDVVQEGSLAKSELFTIIVKGKSEVKSIFMVILMITAQEQVHSKLLLTDKMLFTSIDNSNLTTTFQQ